MSDVNQTGEDQTGNADDQLLAMIADGLVVAEGTVIPAGHTVLPPQFGLVLQDSIRNPGEIEISGGFHPEFDLPDSPSHIVGKFIRVNFASIIAAAQEDRALTLRLASPAPDNVKRLVLPSGI